ALVSLDDVEGPVMGGDERRHLGQDQVGDRVQVALALQHLGVLGDVGLEPVLLGVLLGRLFEVADQLVDLVGEQCDLALGLHPNRPGQVALGYRRCHFGDRPNLGGQVGGQPIDVIGEVLPGAGGAGYAGLAAQLALDADFAGHGRDLLGEGGQGVGHLVDGVGQSGDLALGLEHDFAPQVAVGDRGHDPCDAAHLGGEVGGQLVDAVGEVAPGAGGAQHVGRAAQAALGADFAGHARDLADKGIQLIDHAVNGVLQVEDLAADVDRDLLGQVAHGDRGGDLGDVAHVRREVAGHEVDVVGEVFPDPHHALYLRLSAQLAFGTDLTGHPGDFRSKGVELVDHDVDRFFQLPDLAMGFDLNLLREVAALPTGRAPGVVAHVGGEVAGQLVDVLGQVFPGSRGARHLGLAAQLAFGADLARHPGDLAGEGVELIDHDVD